MNFDQLYVYSMNFDQLYDFSMNYGKGSSKCEKVNNSQKQSSLTGKVDREKLSCSIESLQQMKKDLKETEEKVSGNVITMLGKTDDGIKREVKHFDRSDAEKMRQALQDKAARIKAMMNRPEEPKPKERKRKKEISDL
jgi:small-conductance mechanosensitive channel